MKKIILSLLLLTAISISYQKVEASTFSDVANTHFAKDAIEWASKEGFVNGYGNGKFGPNDAITAEQFAKLTAVFFNLQPNEFQIQPTDWDQKVNGLQSYSSWSAPYFSTLAAYEVPYLFYEGFEHYRMKPINRGLVAQVYGYLLTGDAEINNSIAFLKAKGITKMKYPHYLTEIMQFDIKSTITRAETVTFFYRLANNNLKTIHSSVQAKKDASKSSYEDFRAGYYEAANLIDSRVSDYIKLATRKLYSEQTTQLENAIFAKELAAYPLNVKKQTTDEFSIDAVHHLLGKRFDYSTLMALANRGYTIGLSVLFKEFGEDNPVVYLANEQNHHITFSEDAYWISFGYGWENDVLTADDYNFIAALASDFYNSPITVAQLKAGEQWKQKNPFDHGGYIISNPKEKILFYPQSMAYRVEFIKIKQ